MTAERKNHIITAISKKAKALSPEGSEIILFGSQARGDAHNGSDWDVLILLDKDRILPSDYDEYSYPLRELGWDLGECVNTVLYTKNDWQKEAFSPFYDHLVFQSLKSFYLLDVINRNSFHCRMDNPIILEHTYESAFTTFLCKKYDQIVNILHFGISLFLLPFQE